MLGRVLRGGCRYVATIYRRERRITEKMTPEERARYDAQAQAEAWDRATRILQPWVQATREIGHPQLTQVMEHAFEEAEREYRRALGEVERLGQNATR